MDNELKSWRKDMRAQLMETRMAVPPETRTEAAAGIAERLAQLVKPGRSSRPSARCRTTSGSMPS